MMTNRYPQPRPSYGVTPGAAYPTTTTTSTNPTYRTASSSARSGAPSTAFQPRIDFKDNCGAIVEERSTSGRVVNRWRCGRILGRGGFAKCFEFTNCDTREIVACKVIEKASLAKPKAWSKLQSEIAIHKKMKHIHIVNFLSTFQDSYYVYITLEICQDQTLMELMKARGRFSLAETQYFMLQILSATQYMHDNNVIHRDLKLGNVMLHEMVVKIGDFGLAAEVTNGEQKRTICGTPNYIAPEILEGSHSFEADIWSIGVILYTMLVGKPPFETNDVKLTYSRIKQCKYAFPVDVDVPESAKRLVHRILQASPMKRPSLSEIRSDSFFTNPIPPMMTPASLLCDSVVPKARGVDMCAPMMNPVMDKLTDRGREPLRSYVPNVNVGGPLSARPCARDVSPPAAIPTSAVPMQTQGVSVPRSGSVPAVIRYGSNSLSPQAWGAANAPFGTESQSPRSPLDRVSVVPTSQMHQQPQTTSPVISQPTIQQTQPQQPSQPAQQQQPEDDEEEQHLTRLHDHLQRTLLQQDVADDIPIPPGGPTVWVTDYADFSHKYGLAYRMNSGNTGVHYNDNTKMVWDHGSNTVEYIARQKENVYGTVVAQDVRSSFSMENPPTTLTKKITLIKYFRTYLTRTTPSQGGVDVIRCTNNPTPITGSSDNSTYVKRWMLTKDAVIFRLSNRTIQVCFYDKTEILLSSESRIVTFTDKNGIRRSYGLKEAGLKDEVAPRLQYTKDVLFRLISK
eukprot:PhF_6_TR24779/c2_g2_i1/m.34041/K06631/PLK1; polo-like kinase 1